MLHFNDTRFSSDPFNLSRFLEVQENCYETVLGEIRGGRKRTHWMWFFFPQFEGLAFSSTSQHYAIRSVEEARAYLVHPILGPRLIECAEAVMALKERSAREIFGSPDDLKLRSCATLFGHVSPAESVFERVLEKYFGGERDGKTLELLGLRPETERL